MQRQSRTGVLDMLWVPPMAALFFAVRVLYGVCFAWWYDPWQQKKANGALWNDLQSEFYFLTSRGTLVSEGKVKPLPFDYASVSIVFENLRFCFTRGRGEVSVTMSPLHAPGHSYYIDDVLAVLDSKDRLELAPTGTLREVAKALRSHLDAIRMAFSEAEYPGFREKLLKEREEERIATRQLEWQVNRRPYRDKGGRTRFL